MWVSCSPWINIAERWELRHQNRKYNPICWRNIYRKFSHHHLRKSLQIAPRARPKGDDINIWIGIWFLRCERKLFWSSPLMQVEIVKIASASQFEPEVRRNAFHLSMLTAIWSSTREALRRGLTFCHNFHHGQVRSLRYLRNERWTTVRAIRCSCNFLKVLRLM